MRTHALKHLACRARVTPARSHAPPCWGEALTSLLNAELVDSTVLIMMISDELSLSDLFVTRAVLLLLIVFSSLLAVMLVDFDFIFNSRFIAVCSC